MFLSPLEGDGGLKCYLAFVTCLSSRGINLCQGRQTALDLGPYGVPPGAVCGTHPRRQRSGSGSAQLPFFFCSLSFAGLFPGSGDWPGSLAARRPNPAVSVIDVKS